MEEVLLVDSNDEYRENLAKELRKLGYSVTQADDGTKCLRMMETKSWRWFPKFIFVDSVLSGVSSFELIRRLSTQFEKKEPILIMISNFKAVEDEVESLTAGASGYLVKPFKFDDVKKIEARVIEKKKKLALSET